MINSVKAIPGATAITHYVGILEGDANPESRRRISRQGSPLAHRRGRLNPAFPPGAGVLGVLIETRRRATCMKESSLLPG